MSYSSREVEISESETSTIILPAIKIQHGGPVLEPKAEDTLLYCLLALFSVCVSFNQHCSVATVT